MIKNILQNKVFKNFSYLTIGSILSQLISLLTVFKITKILHPDDYGLYTFMIAQGTLLLTVGDLGIRNIVIRTIARDPYRSKDLIYNGAILRTLALLILGGIYLVYNHLLGNLQAEELLFVLLFALISCFGKLFETAFLGHQKMLPPSVINLGFSIVWFLWIFLLPGKIMDVPFLFYSFLGLNVLKNLVFHVTLRKHGLILGKMKSFVTSSYSLLKESWPYLALVLVMLPYTKFTNNFLDINSTREEIGYFNLSERLTGPISFVLDFGLVAIFPNLSALWVSNKIKFKNFVSIGFKYYMLFGMLLCFLFTLFAKELFGLIFPESYLPAVLVCQLQVWYLFLTSIDSLIGTVFGATNNERKILRLGIVNSLFSTPILFFSSQYGALGLASGMVFSFAIFQVYLWHVFRKTLQFKIEDRSLMWVSAAVLFVFSYFIGSEIDIIYKLLVACLALILTGMYFFRNYTLAKSV
ncbi:oligosaccharide flippase family protein [Cyclobacterium jeungdonense]|uniref:Oligosaccharide flippase family protein n=1 Tax=Cyclobacterium jeungdonense TaxID=708087 RepID=A0ABT8C454_9BACT|nr:oligosaccharide flippase family protein [Cyclobacterium jeungdonense]MDN3686553.1 oligosaccharide flippase family protein [Cyclobacterium jeungdonense]